MFSLSDIMSDMYKLWNWRRKIVYYMLVALRGAAIVAYTCEELK